MLGGSSHLERFKVKKKIIGANISRKQIIFFQESNELSIENDIYKEMISHYEKELPKFEMELCARLEDPSVVLYLSWAGFLPTNNCYNLLEFPIHKGSVDSFAIQKNSELIELFSFM